MQLIYEGVDITQRVDIHRCIHRDLSRGRCDSAEIEFEHAAEWYAWQPEQGERIEITHDGYSTGTLYLNTILPEGGRYRLIAASLPPGGGQRAWQSFCKMSLGEIMRSCAAQCGMEYSIYGLDEGQLYPYIERQDESCAAFISRLMEMEGAVLKCVNGKMAGIALAYAQDIAPAQEIEIGPEQGAARFMHMGERKYGGIILKTPYAEAFALDSAASGQAHISLTQYPAMDNLQAGRWARGLLLTHNRQAEALEFTSELNIGMTALARIDISGGTDADGEWIVDEAEHDFIRERTRTRLMRCIRSIS